MHERQNRTDQIIGLIDAILPQEDNDIVQEVGALIMPQLEMIVELYKDGFDEHRDWMDTHHPFFPRTSYRSRAEKQFRRSFVVPINRGVHEELHYRIEPPEMPRRAVMLGYISLLDKKETNT